MDAWPPSVHDEVGYVVGLAVRSIDWNIVVVFPGGNPQDRCGHFEDSVSTSYNYNTGQVVTTKTLKWQWD